MKELRIEVLNFLAVGPSFEMPSNDGLFGVMEDKPGVGDCVKFLLGVDNRDDLNRSPLPGSPFDVLGT